MRRISQARRAPANAAKGELTAHSRGDPTREARKGHHLAASTGCRGPRQARGANGTSPTRKARDNVTSRTRTAPVWPAAAIKAKGSARARKGAARGGRCRPKQARASRARGYKGRDRPRCDHAANGRQQQTGATPEAEQLERTAPGDKLQRSPARVSERRREAGEPHAAGDSCRKKARLTPPCGRTRDTTGIASRLPRPNVDGEEPRGRMRAVEREVQLRKAENHDRQTASDRCVEQGQRDARGSARRQPGTPRYGPDQTAKRGTGTKTPPARKVARPGGPSHC